MRACGCSDAVKCRVFNSNADLPYWQEIEGTCTPCLNTDGCGFCLSTLRCVAGDDVGPTDENQFCPDWLGPDESCPIKPSCHEYDESGQNYGNETTKRNQG